MGQENRIGPYIISLVDILSGVCGRLHGGGRGFITFCLLAKCPVGQLGGYLSWGKNGKYLFNLVNPK